MCSLASLDEHLAYKMIHLEALVLRVCLSEYVTVVTHSEEHVSLNRIYRITWKRNTKQMLGRFKFYSDASFLRMIRYTVEFHLQAKQSQNHLLQYN